MTLRRLCDHAANHAHALRPPQFGGLFRFAIRNPKAYLHTSGPTLWSCVMFSSPSIVPDTDDHDVYLVLDEFGGRLGRVWRETDEDRTDREIVITDLMTGQYCDPVRVVAFNTAEGWSRDVTSDIADELAKWF